MNKLFLDFDCTIADSVKTYCKVYNMLYNQHENFKEADYNKVKRFCYRKALFILGFLACIYMV